MDGRAGVFEDRMQTKTDNHHDELTGLFERWTRRSYSHEKGKKAIDEEEAPPPGTPRLAHII